MPQESPNSLIINNSLETAIVEETEFVEEKEEIIAPISFTVSTVIKKLQQMKNSVNSLQTLQNITEIINKYIDLTSKSVQILMQYMPMDNIRIKIY